MDGNGNSTTSSGLAFAQLSHSPKPDRVDSTWCMRSGLTTSRPWTGRPTAVRSRLVVTEINSHATENVSQSTPPIECSRLVLSLGSSGTDSSGQHDRLVAKCDVRVAFFHAPASGKIAMIPPKGLVESGCCWFRQKACTAQERRACVRVIDRLAAACCASVQVAPLTFHHDKPGSTTCHGDDVLAALDHLDRVLGKAFDVKVLPRMGPPGFRRQAADGNHVGHTIAWTPRGFVCGAATHHTLLTSSRSWFSVWTRGARARQPPRQAARTRTARRTSCRVSALSCSGRPRRQLCTFPSKGHSCSLQARDPVWHVHACCDVFGDLPPFDRAHAAIPRRTLGQLVPAAADTETSLCLARSNDWRGTCLTAVSPSKLWLR